MINLSAEKKVYHLSDIGKSLQNMIEKHYRSGFWIKAEISKLNYYPKTGHCFPDLVERKDGKIKAQMRGIIWSTHYQKISTNFLEIAKTPLEDGMQILFRAKVTYHQTYGFSLQIIRVDPAFTLGELAIEKEKCIKRLTDEKLYLNNKNLPTPLLIKRLAIVSYNTSKGYADFLNIIQQYKHKFNLQYQLFPSLLQGDKAEKQLVQQLQLIEKRATSFDAICILRGGGGEVGMNCYNSFEVAEAIAKSSLPVYTGIGHSTNETVSEMIAHKNCITPTDFAYHVVERFNAFDVRITSAKQDLRFFVNYLLENQQLELLQTSLKLKKQVKHIVKFQNQLLLQLNNCIHTKPVKLIQKKSDHLHYIQSGIKRHPLFKLQVAKKELAHHQHVLLILASSFLSKQNQAVQHQAQRLKYLSPNHTLQRGYSLILKNGKIITDITELKLGDTIENFTHLGKISSEIKSITPDEENEIQ